MSGQGVSREPVACRCIDTRCLGRERGHDAKAYDDHLVARSHLHFTRAAEAVD